MFLSFRICADDVCQVKLWLSITADDNFHDVVQHP